MKTPMTQEEVVTFMEGATSAADWDTRCDSVKSRCGGYPDFWWPALMQSGIAARVLKRLGSDADIHVTVKKA